MQIIVNGDPVDVDAGVTIAALLAQIGKPAEHVAVEHNGEILEAEHFGAMALQANDRLEIVHFVGGG